MVDRRITPRVPALFVGALACACGPSPEEKAFEAAALQARAAGRDAEERLTAWDQAARACEEPSVEHVVGRLQEYGGVRTLERLTDAPVEIDDPAVSPVFLIDGDVSTYSHPKYGSFLGEVSSLPADHPARPESARLGSRSHLCATPPASAYQDLRATLERHAAADTLEAYRAHEQDLREGIAAVGEAPQGEPVLADTRIAVLFETCATRSLMDYGAVDDYGNDLSLGAPSTSLSAYQCSLRAIWLDPDGSIRGVVTASSDEHEPTTPKTIDKGTVDAASGEARKTALAEAATRLAAALEG